MNSQKREDILTAALGLVSQHGFHGTSMAMIAAAANSGAGTIYNYFASKDDLMRALFVQIKQEFVQRVLDGVTAQMPLRVRFYRMWRNIILYYIQYPDRVAFAQQFHYSPYFDQASLDFVNQSMASIVQPFAAAMRQGWVKSMPLPVLEAFTLDVATSLARRHIKGELRVDDDLIDRTAEMCWAAICTGKAEQEV